MNKSEESELLKELRKFREDAKRKERRHHLTLVFLGIPLGVVVFLGIVWLVMFIRQ